MNSIAQPISSIACGRHILRPNDWERIRISLKLSPRELQITQHIFDDNKVDAIAGELGLSVHTVNTYLQRLYGKLDLRSRSQLVLRIVESHLSHIADNLADQDPADDN